ncbi:hypothetical protein ACLI4Z_09600 [Natrialbaceae archaeon A-arb3/5]
MSVIRQPGVLGRTTRRRLVGVTVALTAAVVETLAVGLWFGLVVDSPSPSTALAGLGILFCGSVLRAGIFGATVSGLGDFLQPRRLGAALALTGGWLSWLFVADAVGGAPGVAVATVVLLLALTGQFVLERRVFERRMASQPTVASVLPAALLALGGSLLLGVTWFTDLQLVSPPLSLEVTTIVLRIEPLQVGILLFGLLAFLAHQRRFQYVLEP